MRYVIRPRLSLTLLASILLSLQTGYAACVSSELIGLIGGIDVLNPYSAFVSPTNIQPDLSPLPFGGTINDVHINNAGMAIIGGDNLGAPYAALISPSSVITPLSLPPIIASVTSVAINSQGYGLATYLSGSGSDLVITNPTGILYLETVAPSELTTAESVAINDQNIGLIGGNDGGVGAYAAIVHIGSGQISSIASLPSPGNIGEVAINNVGIGLIGGDDGINGYAAFVNASANAIPISLPVTPPITSVAINDLSIGLIASDTSNYAAIVSPTSPPITLPFSATSLIQAVAINSQGTGLISWQDTMSMAAYIAFIDTSSGTLGPIIQPPAGISIPDIDIGDSGLGMLLWTDSLGAQSLSFIAPTGELLSFPYFLPTTQVSSISLINALPTASLNANIFEFANYINTYAPQLAFYFLPSLFNCEYKEALKNAAPMRNAISLFTAENNLFFLNHGLSSHLKNQRHMHARSLCAEKKPQDRSHSVWLEMIGAFSSQNEQKQTPSFNPSMGGAIFGSDKHITENSLFGGGLAYTFTGISEEDHVGSAHINQEYVFLYAAWARFGMYVDGALWAGLFQTHQTRFIRLPGFDFSATSHPKGIQICPHWEIGYDRQKPTNPDASAELAINPFLMFDWVQAWQQKYQETGNGPFQIQQKKHYSSFLRVETGFRFYETISYSSWRLVAEEKLSYVNKTPFQIGSIQGSILGFPGSFNVETLSDTQHAAAVELSLIFEPSCNNYPYGSLSYQGEFAHSYQSHEAILEISWDL